MQDIVHGTTRVRAWPTKRGKPKTQEERDKLAMFTAVQKAAAYLAPGCLAYIHKATKSSPLLVRDVVTMQLYNRWMAFTLEDGRTLFPMPALNDVSDALDVISSKIGEFLVRRVDGWRGVSALPSPPGTKKQTWVFLAANTGGATPTVNPVPFGSIMKDEGSWYSGAPNHEIKPDTPGYYHVEGSFRRTTEIVTSARLRFGRNGDHFGWSTSRTGMRQCNVSSFIYLDGLTPVSLEGGVGGSGTIEAGAAYTMLRVTGPL